jgi:hypothetical protein
MNIRNSENIPLRSSQNIPLTGKLGRAIAQAVSRWLPTAAARVRARSGQVGFVVDKMALGRFSPSSSVAPANLHSTNCSTITLIYHLGLYNRPEVAAVPGDVSPTPLKKNW